MVPSGAAVAPQPKYKSATGEEHYKTTLTGPGDPSFLPSEMKRVNTPPITNAKSLASKPSGFRGFFFDMRSMPADQTSLDSESPVPSKFQRRAPIIPKRSLQSLLPKLSLPKLKRKASGMHQEPDVPEDPLAVTGFQQTPFSQRYGDTRRAKMSRLKAYVDETLKESEEDDGTALSVYDVPDHLPSSPLCPLSSKHPSGGKAICPIHRRKRTALAFAPTAKPSPSKEKASPRIVFEGDFRADGRSKSDADGHRKTSREV